MKLTITAVEDKSNKDKELVDGVKDLSRTISFRCLNDLYPFLFQHGAVTFICNMYKPPCSVDASG